MWRRSIRWLLPPVGSSASVTLSSTELIAGAQHVSVSAGEAGVTCSLQPVLQTDGGRCRADVAPTPASGSTRLMWVTCSLSSVAAFRLSPGLGRGGAL